MSYLGMDCAEVRALSGELGRLGGDVGAVVSAVQRRLADVKWYGADADRFRSDWDGTHLQQLRLVAAALQQAGTEAAGSAEQQERTSR